MDSVKDVKEKIHALYWEKQGNCAETMLMCLGELTDTELEPQVFASVTGLHGAEKLGMQCGLAVAGQMCIGTLVDRSMDAESLIAIGIGIPATILPFLCILPLLIIIHNGL